MSDSNRVFTNVFNLILLLIAIAAFFAIIIFGQQSEGWPEKMFAFLLFGIIMVSLYLSSAIYHAIPHKSPIKKTVQKIDHSMIYLMIAGSYTPICLLVLEKNLGQSLLIVVWCIALIGIILKFVKNPLPHWSNIAIYILMGWLLIITYPDLKEELSIRGFSWLLASGILFTTAAIVFIFGPLINKRLPMAIIDIFHFLVILGTLSFVVLLIKFI